MTDWNTLRYAEYYVNTLGFSVIPIKPEDKRPLLKSWLEFQTRKPTNDEIANWFKVANNNIGIVTGSISGITVVDVDPDADTDALYRSLGGSVVAPTVTTPRGGKHIYFNYFKDIRNRAGAFRAVDIRGDGGYVVAPPSIGVNGASYQWDSPLSQFVLQDLPDNFAREISSVHSPSSIGVEGVSLFTKGRRDEDLFHTANSLIKGGMSRAEATAVVMRLAKACNPPFPEAEALEKVRSAMDRAERKDRNVMAEVREWIDRFDGYFSAQEIIASLGVFERNDKNKIYVALSRLNADKVIEKHGEKHGVFRKVENELEAMDWMNAECEEVKVALPLGLNEFVEIYPNNIVAVAGTPDSGKTALLMNIAKLNMNDHEVHYFNSEMGAAEFRKRLSRHNDIKLCDWKIKAWSRSSNFADCIVPDAINIIDFLEISDAFYKVAAEINDIYRKLDGGLAFIGIQKQPGQDLGRGGTFSSEKPRLYLSCDAGRIKIVKAKNWRDPSRNPNGLIKDFKLLGGASFIEESGWYK